MTWIYHYTIITNNSTSLKIQNKFSKVNNYHIYRGFIIGVINNFSPTSLSLVRSLICFHFAEKNVLYNLFLSLLCRLELWLYFCGIICLFLLSSIVRHYGKLVNWVQGVEVFYNEQIKHSKSKALQCLRSSW